MYARDADEGGEQVASGPTLASFSCRQTSVFLGPNASEVIEINFLPFSPGNKFAVLVLSNPHVGEFLYTIDAEARLPMATGIPFRDDEGSARIPDPHSTSRPLPPRPVPTPPVPTRTALCSTLYMYSTL